MSPWCSQYTSLPGSVSGSNDSCAIRMVSIDRGLDPRDFALVSFRNALALGDTNRARRLQAAAEDEERLVREASGFAGAGLCGCCTVMVDGKAVKEFFLYSPVFHDL